MKLQDKIRISLQGKLLMMVLAIVVISSIFIGLESYKSSTKSLTASVYNNLAALSNDISNQIDAINKKELTQLSTLAKMEFFRDPSISLAEKQDKLTDVLNELKGNYENLAYYDDQGNAILGDGRTMNFGTREYFTTAINGKEYVSDPTLSAVTNTVLQHYSVPVYGLNSNKPIGAIVMVINGNAIYDTIKDIDVGGGMHPSVISRKNSTTIANANGEELEGSEEVELDMTKGIGLVLSHLYAGETRQEIFVDPALNKRMVCAYQPVKDTQWSIFAVAPYDYYFSSIKTMQTRLAFLMLITIIVASIISIVLVGLLIRPLKTVKKSIEEIATGNADLTQRIPAASNDEIGDVVKGFNQFIEKLQQIVSNLLSSKEKLAAVDYDLQESTQETASSITQVISNIDSVNDHIVKQASSVQETAGAVNEISSNIESLEHMIENQTNGVSQASSAVEQMIGNINSVNTAVEKMFASFTTLEENTKQGITSQINANDKILEIDEQSKMLQDANSAIASIAEQTNLLAMNAAIEAAHAGEAGKGFSVVADEIRKLSETSSEQSKSISAELNKIQETIRTVVTVSSETNTAFSSVSKSIEETSEIISQIRGAMEEQQIGSKQIIDALQSMNNSTSEVKVASQEMAAGNKQILDEIQRLQDATDMIKQSVGEMHSGAQRVNSTGTSLSTISQKVTDSIKQIGDEIGLFKV